MLKTIFLFILGVMLIPLVGAPSGHHHNHFIPTSHWCYSFNMNDDGAENGINGKSCFVDRQTCNENLDVERRFCPEVVYTSCRRERIRSQETQAEIIERISLLPNNTTANKKINYEIMFWENY